MLRDSRGIKRLIQNRLMWMRGEREQTQELRSTLCGVAQCVYSARYWNGMPHPTFNPERRDKEKNNAPSEFAFRSNANDQRYRIRGRHA